MPPNNSIPSITMSVRKYELALITIQPNPDVAATISAAISEVQPIPIDKRTQVNNSGKVSGSTTRKKNLTATGP